MSTSSTIPFESIERLLTYERVVPAVEEALVLYSGHKTLSPEVMHLELPERNGAFHIKSTYENGASDALVKIASTFFDNPIRGLSSISSVHLLFNAETGEYEQFFDDRGLITNFRTAATGAVAVKHLVGKPQVRLGLIGTGKQARMHVAAISTVAEIVELKVWGRHQEDIQHHHGGCRNCSSFAEAVSEYIPESRLSVCDKVSQAADGVDVVVTATPTTVPLLKHGDLNGNTLVIAMGADSTHKAELDPHLVLQADHVIVDSRPQNLALGDIYRGISTHVFDENIIEAELGQLIAGTVPFEKAKGIIICSTTGLAAEDLTVCRLIAKAVHEETNNG